MTERSEWEKINAFVDGELTASEKAAMADAVARNGGLAHKVATVTQLKAQLFESFEPELEKPIHLPEPEPRPGAGRHHARWIAAAVLLIAALLGGLATYSLERTAQSAWLSAAVERHRALSAAPTGDLGDIATLIDLKGQQALLPNLASGKLTLTSVADFALGDDKVGLAAHYRGTRGCRVTLFLIPDPAPDLQEALTPRRGEAYSGYEWRHGAVGYLLLAEGMDEGRLKLIAEKVHDASGKLMPLNDEARQQLADSRQRSQPCRA